MSPSQCHSIKKQLRDLNTRLCFGNRRFEKRTQLCILFNFESSGFANKKPKKYFEAYDHDLVRTNGEYTPRHDLYMVLDLIKDMPYSLHFDPPRPFKQFYDDFSKELRNAAK